MILPVYVLYISLVPVTVPTVLVFSLDYRPVQINPWEYCIRQFWGARQGVSGPSYGSKQPAWRGDVYVETIEPVIGIFLFFLKKLSMAITYILWFDRLVLGIYNLVCPGILEAALQDNMVCKRLVEEVVISGTVGVFLCNSSFKSQHTLEGNYFVSTKIWQKTAL